MAQTTKIEWTDVSWNPVHGCSRVSTGCKHCYAETLSLRYGQTSAPWTARNAAQNVTLKPHKLREPLSKTGPWKSPCRVFVNSMSDLFHEQIPDEYIAEVFAVMAVAGQHTFQVLTKRPERMRDLLKSYGFFKLTYRAIMKLGTGRQAIPNTFIMADVLDEEGFEGRDNIWLGVSIESRKWVGRADVLRETPAAVRFISAEPLLGPLVPDGDWEGDATGTWRNWRDDFGDHGGLGLHRIDWLIVGGESGPGHRPFDPEWARDLRDVAAVDGTALFVKQLGGTRPGTKLEDLPEDLRIREFPTVARATIRE
jgi:protein gp37